MNMNLMTSTNPHLRALARTRALIDNFKDRDWFTSKEASEKIGVSIKLAQSTLYAMREDRQAGGVRHKKIKAAIYYKIPLQSNIKTELSKQEEIACMSLLQDGFSFEETANMTNCDPYIVREHFRKRKILRETRQLSETERLLNSIFR